MAYFEFAMMLLFYIWAVTRGIRWLVQQRRRKAVMRQPAASSHRPLLGERQATLQSQRFARPGVW